MMLSALLCLSALTLLLKTSERAAGQNFVLPNTVRSAVSNKCEYEVSRSQIGYTISCSCPRKQRTRIRTFVIVKNDIDCIIKCVQNTKKLRKLCSPRNLALVKKTSGKERARCCKKCGGIPAGGNDSLCWRKISDDGPVLWPRAGCVPEVYEHPEGLSVGCICDDFGFGFLGLVPVGVDIRCYRNCARRRLADNPCNGTQEKANSALGVVIEECCEDCGAVYKGEGCYPSTF